MRLGSEGVMGGVSVVRWVTVGSVMDGEIEMPGEEAIQVLPHLRA